jgi:beta-lactamase regulating signal transducer with metallopeptidase domain
MSDFIDLRLEPGLWLLGDWSLRWGALIVALGIWLALCRPRQAALRLVACQLVLVAGLALPIVPRWWGSHLLPDRWVSTEDEVASARPTTESLDPLLGPAIAKPKKGTVAHASRPVASPEQDLADIPATEPSSGALLGTAEPIGVRCTALLIVALLWFVGTCVQLVRLIAGTIWLSGLPRSALQPSLQSLELFDRCREEMGLRRRVRLGIHPALTAPMFVGGWQASVLVPSDWEGLASEAQRAVLWHELTHVARRDDWAKLAEETIRAAFCFHPLVSWLLNRVDVYREQVCDAAAVRGGVAGRTLAQILVDFSRRNAAPGDRGSALRPALPFFRRRTVKNRIGELLEEKTVARWSAPLVRHQFVGLAVIAVFTGIALGGFGSRASESQAAAAQLAALDPPPQSPPSATSTTAAEKAPATTKSASVPTLDRILANWKARTERMKSVYFAWDSRGYFGQVADERAKEQASPKPADARSRLLQFSFWDEEPDRFRLDSAPVNAVGPAQTPLAAKTHSVIQGTTELLVEEPGNTGGSAVCTVSTGSGQRGRIALPQVFWTLNALTLTIHPLDAFVTGRRVLQFRIVAENAIVDGLRCIEIEKVNAGRIRERCWVDPAREDVVVAYEFQVGPRDATKISIQYQLDRVHGWVPGRWTVKRRGELSENAVTKFTINEQFPEQTFTLNVPPGTIVFDKRTSEEYRVAKDGSKSDVVKFDSPAILKIQQALESKTDFQIEPQSLKDAVDFIAARYQIPIVLNQRDFDAARIDIASEVKFQRAGVAVADVLKSLLVQCQKPAGFRIEDEVLKISPKFVGQEPIHIRPAPVPPKSESNKERKIREALETPVDFNIEPQTLKDALDFIAVRYQINIVIGPSVDSTVTVKGSFPGIRLRSLLTLLLERIPKPMGFKIEDDALQVVPEPPKP